MLRNNQTKCMQGLAMVVVLTALGCSGPDDEDPFNQNANVNANGNSNLNTNTPDGCGFEATGNVGDVGVSAGTALSFDERAADAQNTVDLDRGSQLPTDGLTTLRYSGCGDAGMLLRTDDGLDVRLQYTDPTVSDGLEVVEATANANAHDAVLFFDVDCNAIVLRTTSAEGVVQYTRTAANSWTRSVVTDDLSTVLGAVVSSPRLMGDYVAPDGTLHVFLNATVDGESALIHGSREATVGSAWTFTSLPPAPATELFGYAVDSAGTIYTVYRNTEYPCDPCNVDLYLGTLPANSTDWEIAVVQPGLWGAPNDELVETASLALDSGDNVFIAAHFVRRVITGSYISTELRLYGEVDGQWCGEVVAATSDGYAGADGDGFTGANPHLVIDDQDRFHVLFRDQAIWHDANGWQNEIRGQLRYAVRSGTRWYTHTLLAQDGQTVSPNPLVGLTAPQLAVSSNAGSPNAGSVAAASVRQTWQTDSIYNDQAVPATLTAHATTATITYPQ